MKKLLGRLIEPSPTLKGTSRLHGQILAVVSLGAFALSAVVIPSTYVFINIQRTWGENLLNIAVPPLFAVAYFLARRGWLTGAYLATVVVALVPVLGLPWATPDQPVAPILTFIGFVLAYLGFHPSKRTYLIPGAAGGAIAVMAVTSALLHPRVTWLEMTYVVVQCIVGLTMALFLAGLRHHLRRETKRYQEQLLTSDRMASLGVIAAGLGHEINNPLAYVQMNLEAYRSGGLDDEEAEQALDDVAEGAKRIEAVVHNLHFFARPHREPGPVDVTSVVETTVDIVRPQFRHCGRIDVEVEPNLRVHDVEGRLGQILLNLLTNAVHATASMKEPGHIVLRGRLKREHVLLIVDDNGPGVPEDLRDSVFETFFTTKERDTGSGLGLTICRQLVDAAGGHIELGTSPLGGARFVVSLPALVADNAHAPASRPLLARKTRPVVLVIDDDPHLLRAIGRVLSAADVVPVQSGHEALRQVAELDPDLVLCDLMMPGMNGLDAYRAMLHAWPHTGDRFVFMTGGATGGIDFEAVVSTGCQVLQKPLDTDALRTLVASHTPQSGPQAPSSGSVAPRG